MFPFKVPAHHPDLMGPYGKTGEVGQRFRERFGNTWTKTARQNQWVIGDEQITISYRADMREYALIEVGKTDLIVAIRNMVDNQLIERNIPVRVIEPVDSSYKYPFLQLEVFLKVQGHW